MYGVPKITAEAAASLFDSSIRPGVEALDIQWSWYWSRCGTGISFTIY
jgi:hypothetical protein